MEGIFDDCVPTISTSKSRWNSRTKYDVKAAPTPRPWNFAETPTRSLTRARQP